MEYKTPNECKSCEWLRDDGIKEFCYWQNSDVLDIYFPCEEPKNVNKI